MRRRKFLLIVKVINKNIFIISNKSRDSALKKKKKKFIAKVYSTKRECGGTSGSMLSLCGL